MEHSFNIELAKKYGVLEAILIKNLWFWIEKNKANNKHLYDGECWTYNSNKAFEELFPYAKPRQIRTALEHLREEEIIMVGNYNEKSFDRTLWYAFTEKGKMLINNEITHLSEMTNAFVKIDKPIPYNKHNIYNIKNIKITIVEKVISYMNELAGTTFKSSTKKTRELISARLEEGFTEDDLLDVVFHLYHKWYEHPVQFKNGQYSDYYYKPDTIFNNKFEGYLNDYHREKKRRNG